VHVLLQRAHASPHKQERKRRLGGRLPAIRRPFGGGAGPQGLLAAAAQQCVQIKRPLHPPTSRGACLRFPSCALSLHTPPTTIFSPSRFARAFFADTSLNDSAAAVAAAAVVAPPPPAAAAAVVPVAAAAAATPDKPVRLTDLSPQLVELLKKNTVAAAARFAANSVKTFPSASELNGMIRYSLTLGDRTFIPDDALAKNIKL